jgi:hypothetical protein
LCAAVLVVGLAGCGREYAGGDAGRDVFGSMALPAGTSVIRQDRSTDGYFVILSTRDFTEIRPPSGYRPSSRRGEQPDCPTAGTLGRPPRPEDCRSRALAVFRGPSPPDASRDCSITLAKPAYEEDAAPPPAYVVALAIVCLGLRGG